MKLISLLGLLVLLFIAWLISYHKDKVNLRTVVWGLFLQFLLAIIILQETMASWIGMAIFALLLVFYVFRNILKDAWPKVLWIVGIVLGSALTAFILFLLMQVVPFVWLLLALLVVMLANKYLIKIEKIKPYLSAIIIITIFTAPIANGIYGKEIFQSFSNGVAKFLSMSLYGAEFLFGNLVKTEHFFPDTTTWPGFGYLFAFAVLPTIIFFGGFMAVLYHYGVMQKIVEGMAKFMSWTMGTSGAETLSCAANIFVGQTEAPLLIKPFLNEMTESELLTIMVGGFATIAGGVLAGFIAMGVDAGHLVAASVMSAPAALVMGKIIYPELKKSKTLGMIKMPEIKKAQNVLGALSNGITDGLKLAVNVGAMLIGFIAIMAVIDMGFSLFDKLIDGNLLGKEYIDYAVTSPVSPVKGEYMGIFPGSLKTLFGFIFRPLAFVMGVPWKYAGEVGNLLGMKISLNEFVAYGALGTYIQSGALNERAITIATYALCGFANFSSIGIQLGGIGAVAPGRKKTLAKVALKAMIGGALASWTTATIAGILL
ncbi:MAG: nucleoside transporter C-terminal domain-containing protein [Candidatus Marinimicrobia bacterium]|nr:nucleoside transporter C-terminal domain-containing protein [Candidatus Neomarinimicrobiota bacterium]